MELDQSFAKSYDALQNIDLRNGSLNQAPWCDCDRKMSAYSDE